MTASAAQPGSPPALRRRLWLPAACVAVLGAMVCVALFTATRALEQGRAVAEFRREAGGPVASIRKDLGVHLEALYSVKSFYASSKEVERDEFRAFVEGIILRHPAMRPLAWAPRVWGSERATFEAAASKAGVRQWRILERTAPGRLAVARGRDVYYPVSYAEPVWGNETLFGLDLGSDPVTREALTRARDSGTAVAASADHLLGAGTTRANLMVIVPIYRHGVADDAEREVLSRGLMGFVIGVLRVGDLVAEAVKDSRTRGLEVALYDGVVGHGGRILCVYPEDNPATRARFAEQEHMRDEAKVWSKTALPMPWGEWSVVCRPGPGYRPFGRPGHEWRVLVTGLAITLLITAYVLALTGRTAWAEKLVAQRTKDLSRTNQELQTEIALRERSEEALRQSEERYRSLVETMSDGLSVLDAAGRLTYVNDALCRMLGYSADELLGRPLATLLDESNRAVLEEQIERRRRGDDEPYELALTARNGAQVFTILAPRSMRQADGSYAGSFAVVTNITERKHMEEQLQQALAEVRRSNAELEAFAYVASHDLQEPLRKITTFGDRLQSRYREALDDQGRDYLARMVGAAARMQELIHGLLNYSRVTTRGQPFEPVDLAVVAAEVVSDLEARIEEAQGTVQVGPLPTVDADPTQMRQLLQNLIGNALKFHREDVPPHVVVRAEVLSGPEAARLGLPAPGPVCRLTVQDNGIGFENAQAERIFGVFQRLHGRGEYEGTGIGLAICRRIAERHGGAISATSTPGAGATFTVLLPVRQSVPAEGI